MLWGEKPAEREAAPVKRRGRPAATTRRLSNLPFDAGDEALKASLSEVITDLPAHQASSEAASIWLPIIEGRPLASSPLIAEPPEAGAQLKLARWKVTALALPTAQAIDLLCACAGKETLSPGIIIGADLAFWSQSVRFAGSIVARQSFLPGIKLKDAASPRARWEPVFAGTDVQRLARLAAAMPHACRALTDPSDIAPPDTPAITILTDFLAEVVDGLIRSAGTQVSYSTGARPRKKRAETFESVHDQWLHALRAGEGVMTGDASELARLAEQVRDWQRPVTAQSATPFRLCFRLEEPEERDTETRGRGDTGTIAASPRPRVSVSQGKWHVRYLLQAADDPSLIFPAAQVWNAKGQQAALLKRGTFKPREYLLSALGQAAKVSPHVERSLKVATPGGYELDAAGAHEFLQEQAWLLEQAGFGVMLPAWWSRKGTKLKLTARAVVESPKLQGGGGMSLEEIVKFDWEVALGDERLSLAELEMLARLKSPLVKVRGQWVELNAEEIQAALDFWKKGAQGKARARDIVRMSLGANTEAPGGIAFAGVTATGWIGDLLKQLEGRESLAELSAPDDFRGTLRPYQLRGYSWLNFLRQWGLGACLADDMGLGKCICPESLVFVNGTLKTAEQIWSQNATEAQFDGEGYWAIPVNSLVTNSLDETSGGIVAARITRLYRQRIAARVRRLTLEDGQQITLTLRHRLLTPRGWTQDFKIGDHICIPARLRWQGAPADAELVTFLAWQIAEGYEDNKRASLTITQKDSKILEMLHVLFFRLAARYGFEAHNPAISYPSNRCSYLRLNSVGYRRFLENRGHAWGRRSRDKSIPDFIMQADDETVRVFLRHYFDAEASATFSVRSVEISSASSILMQQLATLLRRFGIWLRVSTKRKCATNGSGILRPYYCGILGGDSARRFRQEIGFGVSHKQQILETICRKECNTNVEGIPASKMVADLISHIGLPLRHLGMHCDVYVKGTQEFSRQSLSRVVSALDKVINGEQEESYRALPRSKWTAQTLERYANLDRTVISRSRDDLQRLIQQEVYYCKIKSIEDLDYEGWVYDFEVERHHNFVANNILCHNTAQTLAFIQRDWLTNGQRPTLVVCPMSVVGNWQKEAARFTPDLPVMVHHGLTRTKGKAFQKAAGKQALVLSSYALLHRDFEFLKEVEWAGVVLDEAQNIKNPQTKQAQAARSLASDYRIALTGTPVENNVGDLWSLMEFLNPGFLGTLAQFKRNFFLPIQASRDEEATRRLKSLTGPFILRRLKTDKKIISDLPEKLEMKVFCTLTKEQASLYAAVVEDAGRALDDTEGIQRKGVVLATLSKLKQVCNHPAQFLGDNSAIPGRSGKLARLTEMLEEVLATGERSLVFTQFAEMGALIQRHLQETFGHEVLFLHGAVPKKRRDQMVARFQSENGGPRVFLLSLKAGGTGLNLTAANHVFHFDRWWNPAVENQATDRAFRIGQKKNVQVHKFLCAGTLEEKIDEMIERKQVLAAQVVGTGEGWLTELSTAALKELFALREDAVTE